MAGNNTFKVSYVLSVEAAQALTNYNKLKEAVSENITKNEDFNKSLTKSALASKAYEDTIAQMANYNDKLATTYDKLINLEAKRAVSTKQNGLILGQQQAVISGYRLNLEKTNKALEQFLTLQSRIRAANLGSTSYNLAAETRQLVLPGSNVPTNNSYNAKESRASAETVSAAFGTRNIALDRAKILEAQSSLDNAIVEGQRRVIAQRTDALNMFDQLQTNLHRRQMQRVEESYTSEVHGANSIELMRVQTNNRAVQSEIAYQNRVMAIRERVSSGSISPESGNARLAATTRSYTNALIENRTALAAQEHAHQQSIDTQRNMIIRIAELVSIYGVLHFTVNKVMAAVYAVPKIGIELDTAKASLEATTGSAAATAGALAWLDTEAKRTGINIVTLRETFRQFQASTSLAGESLNDTTKMFYNINTVITALHLPAQKAQGIFNALAQIFNKSKVQSEELVKQLGNLIPGAFASFAAANKDMFRNSQELIAEMRKGSVFAHETVLKFTEFLAQRFAVSFDIASKGFNASLGRMDTSLQHLGETIYAGVLPYLKGAIEGIASFAEGTQALIKGSDGLGKSLQFVASSLGLVALYLSGGALARGIPAFLAAALGVNRFTVAMSGATLSSTLLTASVTRLKGALAWLISPTSLVAGLAAIATYFVLIKDSAADTATKAAASLDEIKKKLEDADETGKLKKTLAELNTPIEIKVDAAESVKEVKKQIKEVEQSLSRLKIVQSGAPTFFSDLYASATGGETSSELMTRLTKNLKDYNEVLDKTRKLEKERQLIEEKRALGIQHEEGKDPVTVAKEMEARLLAMKDAATGAANEVLRVQEGFIKTAQNNIDRSTANIQLILDKSPELISTYSQALKDGLDSTSFEQLKVVNENLANNLATILSEANAVNLIYTVAQETYNANVQRQSDRAAQGTSKIVQAQIKKIDMEAKNSIADLTELDRQNQVNFNRNLKTVNDFYNEKKRIAKEIAELEIRSLERQIGILQNRKGIKDEVASLGGQRPQQVNTSYTESGNKYSLESVIAAIQRNETGHLTPEKAKVAVSSAGARGVMQVLPSTSAMYGYNGYDPEQSRLAGRQYATDIFLDQKKKVKDMEEAIMRTFIGYHAGAGDIDSVLRNPKGNPKTIAYAKKGMANLGLSSTLPSVSSYAADEQNQVNIEEKQLERNKRIKELANSLRALDDEHTAALQADSDSLNNQFFSLNKIYGVMSKQLVQQEFDINNRTIMQQLAVRLREVDEKLLVEKDAGNVRDLQAHRERYKLTQEFLRLQEKDLEYENSKLQTGQRLTNNIQDRQNALNLVEFGRTNGQTTEFSSMVARAKINKDLLATNEGGLSDNISLARSNLSSARSPEAINKYKTELASAQKALLDLKTSSREVEIYFTNQFSQAMVQPFKDMVTGTSSASEAFASFASNIVSGILDIITQELALKAVKGILGGVGFGSITSKLFPSAKGNAFSNGNVVPFAKGGIVNSPTVFNYAGGIGVAGEAGSEAILPLKRGSNGNLMADGSGLGTKVNAPTYIINVTVPEGTKDAKQFGNDVGTAVLVNIARNVAREEIQYNNRQQSVKQSRVVNG